MELALAFFQNLLFTFLSVLELAMLVRMVFSWLDPDMSWKLSSFLYLVTEPFIQPIRILCYKNNWFQQVPLDIPFLITFLLLSVLETVIMML